MDALSLEYRPVMPADYAQLRELLSQLGWAERVRDDARFAAMLEGADRTVVAIDGGRVVGFGRALCDGVSNGYISMLAVAEEHQRQGIGRAIVERLTADSADGQITWVLRAGRDSIGFWERLGFAKSSIAMERLRSKERPSKVTGGARPN